MPVSMAVVYHGHRGAVQNSLPPPSMCAGASALLQLCSVASDEYASPCGTSISGSTHSTVLCSTEYMSDSSGETERRGADSTECRQEMEQYATPTGPVRSTAYHSITHLQLPQPLHTNSTTPAIPRSLLHSHRAVDRMYQPSVDPTAPTSVYNCPYSGCGKWFKKANAVRRHTRCHTGTHWLLYLVHAYDGLHLNALWCHALCRGAAVHLSPLSTSFR